MAEKTRHGSEIGRELYDLAEHSLEWVQCRGAGLENRQDKIIRTTENYPVKPSTIRAGRPAVLMNSHLIERDRAQRGVDEFFGNWHKPPNFHYVVDKIDQ